MNFRKFLVGALCFLALGTSFTACSDDDDVMNDNGSKVELPSRRAYILYEGSFAPGAETNNTGIAFYAPNKDKDFIADIFAFNNNDKALGNLGQHMVEDGDFIYVTASSSSSVIKMNEACVEVARCDFEKGADPRFMVAEGGFLYVTHYGGTVSKIDQRTMKVVKSLKINGGYQLEGITECNGKLYVANAYRVIDPSAFKNEYLKDVFVINPQTMAVESTIKVADNPKTLIEEEDQIFLLSLGNYKEVLSQLQVIDPRTQKVTNICPAGFIAEGSHDRIFIVNVEYDKNYKPTNILSSYNAETHQLNKQSFVNNAPDEMLSGNIYMISVDDDTDEIYIGTTDYSNVGTIYRFDSNGNYKEKFSAGGVNPNTMVFVD